MVGTGYVCNIARLGVGVKKILCEVVDFFAHVKKRGIFLHEAGCRVKKVG